MTDLSVLQNDLWKRVQVLELQQLQQHGRGEKG